jgi:hypothetical protein
MPKNKNPVTVAAVGGAKVLTDLSGRDLTPAAVEKKASYKIHVDLATGEERLPCGREPYLTVIRKGAFEYCTTVDIQTHDAFNTSIMVKPRGRGWERHDTSSDKWTTFRRKAVRP